jgi:hypothetical protein
MVRKLVTLENPVYCLTEKEDKFHLNISFMVMTTDFNFKLGEEIDHKFPDGVLRKVSLFLNYLFVFLLYLMPLIYIEFPIKLEA